MNIRGTVGDYIEVGTSNIVALGLAVENAHVEYSDYRLLSGEAADKAYGQYSQGVTFGDYKENAASPSVYYGNDLGASDGTVKIYRKRPGFSRTYVTQCFGRRLRSKSTYRRSVGRLWDSSL